MDERDRRKAVRETSAGLRPRTMMTLGRGAIVIAAGFVGWLTPAPTVATLSVLFGGFALLDASCALAIAFVSDGAETWATGLWLEAVASIGAGVLTLYLPDPQMTSLAAIVGTWAAVTGVVEMMTTHRAAGVSAARTLVGIAAGLALGAAAIFALRGGGRLLLFQVAIVAFSAGICLAFVGARLFPRSARA